MRELKLYEAPPFSPREALRYARASASSPRLDELMFDCLAECEGVLNYKIAYCELSFTIIGDFCDFGAFSVRSRALSENLASAKKVILFVASVGARIDRLIEKYERISPLRALMVSAIGSERVEALADAFMASAVEITEAHLTAWRAEWAAIESVVAELYPTLEGLKEDSEAIAALLAEGKYVMHHSRKYNRLYAPHYRIVSRKEYEKLKTILK
jgi:hypothetical protein